MADSQKTREVMRCVNHQQTKQLLHNKFVVVLGDSIQRSVYKDLVLLLQKDKHLSVQQLRKKGEMSFELDCLIEGGCLNPMNNGTQYREVRQFQSSHHLVRFYFVTKVYNCYMQSILEDFRSGIKPDVLIINSCVWDISRYNSSWSADYRENLQIFFEELTGILPKETLVIWGLAMPLSESIKGGFLVPEIEHKAPKLRYDVIEANFFSATLADAFGFDVLDFHFQFRSSLHHRTKDGIHWNALAHRRITSLLLDHAARAWGVDMPCALTTVENNEEGVKKAVMSSVVRSSVVRASVVRPAERYAPPRNNRYIENHCPPPWCGRSWGYRPPSPPRPPPMFRWEPYREEQWNGRYDPAPFEDHRHTRQRRRHAPYTYRSYY